MAISSEGAQPYMYIGGKGTGAGFGEFVALMALMISLVALSIDAMIPALSRIAADLSVHRANSSQLVISAFIFGISIGQMIYGPLSDSTGRKPAVYAGLGLFIIGCLLSMAAVNFPMMLAGRVIQGIGLAGPRSVTIAIIRDRFEGRGMAQVISFIMAVFIIVPAMAPALGQGILMIAGWRAIFAACLGLALVVCAWFAARQPETLTSARRRRFSLRMIGAAIAEICTIRETFGYTIAAGLVFGAFQGYLNSAQQVFQIQYARGVASPLYYASLASAFGLASLVNAKLVMRLGMQTLTTWASRSFSAFSALFFIAAWPTGGNPPLWALMTYLFASFFCLGLIFGNLNALAMQPLGHIAGTGAAVVGSLSLLLSVPCGLAIGQGYNGTILPLTGGFALFGAASMLIIGRMGRPVRRTPQTACRLDQPLE